MALRPAEIAMYRKGMLVITVGLALAADAPKDKPADEKVKALTERAFAAIGGEDKLTTIPAATKKMVWKQANGDVYTQEEFVQKPDRLRGVAEGVIGGKKSTSLRVIHGDKVWGIANGMPVSYRPESVAQLKLYIRYFPALSLIPLRDRTSTLEALGESKVEGHAVLGIKVTRKVRDGVFLEQRLFFDKASGLLLFERSGTDNVVQTAYSDYQEVAGIKIPRKEIVTRDGEPLLTREVVNFQVHDKLDPKLFEEAAGAGAHLNLRQLGAAMYKYQEANGSLPAAAVYDPSGKPLLSWRVLLLPYLGHRELYEQFHLDEPWDSENNKKLQDKMPPEYLSPGREASHRTHYQVFVGKGAMFEGKKGQDLGKIPDGAANTILLVEAAQAVPWTSPEDLPYDPDKPLPRLDGLHPGGFLAVMCNFSVRFVSEKVKPETLHRAIQRADGQPPGPDF
jgi:hypothetical protein